MDNLESGLREVNVNADNTDSRNGFAPPGALLAALWGDKPAGKLQLYLSSEAVRTFTGVLLEVE